MRTKEVSLIHRLGYFLRTYLNRHVSIHSLRKTAFSISLVSCLTAGSPMLFALFSASLHEIYKVTYWEINLIVSSTAIGMYFFLPILGYLSDSYGPSLLSLILIWLYVPSYFANSEVIRNLDSGHETTKAHVYVLCAGFFLIGLATSSFYFLSLLTCAKIYPLHKGLAISLPVTCYGLSSLIGSQLMKLEYFRGLDGCLNLFRVFRFFEILYLIMCILNFLTSLVVTVESVYIFPEEGEDPTVSESSALISDSFETNSCEENELVSHSSHIDPISHRVRYIKFLKDKTAWLFLGSLILNLGPLETFQSNLGSIIENTSLANSKLSDQLSLMAASSTILRLLAGLLIEYISKQTNSGSRMTPALLTFITLGGLGHYLLMKKAPFYVASIVNGAAYGGLFTIYPTIVASIWGIDLMGSTWGTFMLAPALGSIFFSLFYGNQVDTVCSVSAYACLSSYFKVTTVAFLLSFLFITSCWSRISSSILS